MNHILPQKNACCILCFGCPTQFRIFLRLCQCQSQRGLFKVHSTSLITKYKANCAQYSNKRNASTVDENKMQNMSEILHKLEESIHWFIFCLLALILLHDLSQICGMNKTCSVIDYLWSLSYDKAWCCKGLAWTVCFSFRCSHSNAKW